MSYSMKGNKLRALKLALFIAAGLAVIAIVAAGITYKTYRDNLKPFSSSQNVETLTIPSGSSVRQIGIQLEEAQLIRKSWAFEWYVRLNGLRDKMQAGTYAISPNQNVADISKLLTRGLEKTDQVTILPAQRLDQVRARFINSGFPEAEVDVALDPATYAGHPALSEKPAEANLEGYLYPDTYLKTSDTSASDVVRLALDEMNAYLTPDVRNGIKQQGLSVHQGIILASIIDREVGDTTIKPTVAQVFLRRLREGIRLQSDPTALYGAALDGAEPSLKHDSPYNTYNHNGLTPTPIGNVTKSALEAVANPSNSDFLFFVAGDDGKTYFSRTQSEHEALAREHCKKLCSQ